MEKPRIWIVLGSLSDLPTFDDARDLLLKFKVNYDVKVLSAHRSPKLLAEEIENLPKEVDVIITAAGGAAHLAGAVAAHTVKPVIGVPMNSTLNGFDSLLSTSQMPAGVPVAAVSIGQAGATNAALLACEILALHDERIRQQLLHHRNSLVEKVLDANRKLAEQPE